MGRVGAPHGVKGWVRVVPYTESPDTLERYPAWWIGKGETWREVEVAEAATRGTGFFARFAGCSDREAAGKIRGCEIAVPRTALPEPAPDEYYCADLVGLDVINIDGVPLGRVASVFSNGAHDLLRVTSGERERLLPFVAEVICAVDFAQRRIEVDWGADW
jgi:16S rRNA processing protein RimM